LKYIVAIFIALWIGTNTSIAIAKGNMVHRGATALTWLTNPAHKKFGTKKTRSRAIVHSENLFYTGLKETGFYKPALCVHGYEAKWNDPGAPYYGGMQMDIEFQRTYGLQYYYRWGTADNWPVWAQLHAAYKGYQDRGWWPWPNTARYCGLL
jgi:hypothetical protein